MRNAAALVLAVVCACKGGDADRAAKPAPPGDAGPPAGPTVTRRVATLAPPGTPWMRILDRGARQVADATGGRVTTEFFFGGAQGDELDMVRKMKLGQLDGAALTSVGLGMIYPGIRVLQLPFLFESVEELDHVRERVWPHFQAEFRKAGFELRDPSDVGWVRLFSKRPIASVKDLKAAKPWLWKDDPITAAMFERLGVAGVPLGVPDVLPSLKSGRIDACYASPLAAVALQWYTEVTHATSLELSYGTGALVLRAEAWNAASDADRAAETRIAHETAVELVARIRADNARALDALKQAGVTVVDTPAPLATALEQAAHATWDQLAGDVYTRDELDMVLRHRDEYRAQRGASE
jgi:TRAP-type C4-dicarboxylate transport system substrate-binding protein